MRIPSRIRIFSASRQNVLARIFYLGCSFIVLAMMILAASGSKWPQQMRQSLTDALSPVLGVVSGVVQTADDMLSNAQELALLRAENEKLRDENARLKEWQQQAIKLAEENQTLRKSLNLPSDMPPNFVTARIISDTSGAFVRSLIINAGTADNVKKGHAVLYEGNFIGRVMEAGEHASRILMITDFASRVPVVIADTGEQGILTGNNSNVMRVVYVNQPQSVNPGDKVLTSGKGGGLPAGLPIGIVEQWAGEDIKVKPLVDLASLRYVQVVDYGLIGLLESFSENPKAKK